MHSRKRLNLEAVLGYRSVDGWRSIQLNCIHDASNANEVQRIKEEHPDETDSFRNNRVIGFLEPTRGRVD